LPREVITGNTGLCIELSLMYASVLKAAGLHPIIFLIPGHAFPGILINNYYYAIEATGVGGQGLNSIMSADQAFAAGSQELKTFIDGYQKGDTRNIIIDVNDLEAKGVVPMELSDDDFLRKKVDDIAASFSGGGTSAVTAANATANKGGGGGGNTRRTTTKNDNGGGGSSVRTYSGAINVSYPASWTRKDYPVQQLNTLASRIISPDQSSGISVWNISASNPDQALYIVRTQLAAFQQYITYQRTGTGNGYTLYQGVSTYNGVQQRWEGAFRTGGNGVVGVTVGGLNYNANVTLFNNIISSVR
jgi:hypothetical protein